MNKMAFKNIKINSQKNFLKLKIFLFDSKYYILRKFFRIFSKNKILTYRATTKVKNNPLGSFEWIENLDLVEKNKLPFASLSKLLPVKHGKALQIYTFQNGKSYGLNNATIDIDSYKVKVSEKQMLNKPNLYRNDKVALLNYSSNHFGHFIAESFGSIIYFSRIYKTLFKTNNIKFITLIPSQEWIQFLKKITDFDNFECINSNDILKNNYMFNHSFLFRNLSRFQNLLVGRNSTLSYLSKFENAEFKEKKYFLSSCSSYSRIENIKELEKWLSNNNFEILDPILEKPLKLLLKLRDAKIVITEQGSIIFNILLSRLKKTILLTSNELMSEREFASGGLFNSHLYGIWDELICKRSFNAQGHDNSTHQYSNPIIVDINKLEILVNDS